MTDLTKLYSFTCGECKSTVKTHDEYAPAICPVCTDKQIAEYELADEYKKENID